MNAFTYDFALKPLELAGLSKLRQELLRHAQGKILEIGMGTGLNLPYYSSEFSVIGIEPDPAMRRKAIKRVHHQRDHIIDGDAQSLNFPDQEFDTVVATLVFCTIPDPAQAMAEVHRVLREGGRFLLLEHVRKNTPLAGKVLDTLTPLWKHLANGCHLNRDPGQLIIENGFKVIESKTLWKGLGKLWVLEK